MYPYWHFLSGKFLDGIVPRVTLGAKYIFTASRQRSVGTLGVHPVTLPSCVLYCTVLYCTVRLSKKRYRNEWLKEPRYFFSKHDDSLKKSKKMKLIVSVSALRRKIISLRFFFKGPTYTWRIPE